MSAFGNATTKDMCSKMDTQKVGNTYVIDSVCKMGPSTNTSRSVITGDFNSAYTVKLSSVTSGGPNLPGARPDGKTEMTMEARWTGACKADQKPGDIIMSNGVKMNIRDLQKVQSSRRARRRSVAAIPGRRVSGDPIQNRDLIPGARFVAPE